MKTKSVLVTAGLAVLSLCQVSCSQAQHDQVNENVENIGKNIDTAATETREAFVRDKEEFSAAIHRQMEKNRQDIQDLKAKARLKKEEARKSYDEAIDKIEKKNDELKARLDAYNDDSKEKWKSFKEEFSHDMDELGQAISDLFRDNVK